MTRVDLLCRRYSKNLLTVLGELHGEPSEIEAIFPKPFDLSTVDPRMAGRVVITCMVRGASVAGFLAEGRVSVDGHELVEEDRATVVIGGTVTWPSR
jgi:hypothetical protein